MSRYGLVCTRCSKKTTFRYNDTRCVCGGTLLVEYDLERIAGTINKTILKTSCPSMWRYKELLPLISDKSIVSLGEGWTPLIRIFDWEKKLPLKQLWIKREEQNPTGSFKSRGFSVAVSLLKESGKLRPAVPSNGNAASALAAYAGSAGMQAYVFIPVDCPPLIIQECIHYGAATFLVDGYIHDAAAIIEEGKKEQGWTSVATLKEPGRVEGKKTMGIELAEQLGWVLPDVIIYPTGGGSGIIGMWKAFHELKTMGWITGDLPRFVCVQEEGCQPIVDAVGLSMQAFPLGSTSISANPTGMRVLNPPDMELLVRIIKETNGTAVTVSQPEIIDAQISIGSQGVSPSPEGAATWAGLLKLCEHGWIDPSDTVVLFNTAHAMKYSSLKTPLVLPKISSYQEYVNFTNHPHKTS
ncbi:MAG TPA: threonine synthase [Bacilli bacterium]